MSERISCPECRRVLCLPRDCMDPWLACPGCAARIPNPQARGITEEAEDRGRACPSCGAGVESRWLFCPRCEEPLHDPGRPPSRGGYLDAGRKDRRWEGTIDLLVVLGLIGITIALAGGVLALSKGNEAPLVVTLAVLVLLAGISAAVVLAPGNHSDQPRGTRIVVMTLTLAGVLVAGCCLLAMAGCCLLAVARFIFLLAVCLAQ